MYWLQLIDKYAANWSVLLIAIFECVLIAWIYGSQRFLDDIQGMIGERSALWNKFWSIMWRLITPATLLVRSLFMFAFPSKIFLYYLVIVGISSLHFIQVHIVF